MKPETQHYLRMLHDAIQALLRAASAVSYVQLTQQPEARQRVFMPLLDVVELNASVVPSLRAAYPHLHWDALTHLKAVATSQYFGADYAQHWAGLLDQLPLLADGIATELT